jgi:hypothetical protein
LIVVSAVLLSRGFNPGGRHRDRNERENQIRDLERYESGLCALCSWDGLLTHGGGVFSFQDRYVLARRLCHLPAGQTSFESLFTSTKVMNIQEAKQKHEENLMRLPNVMGVGIGEKAGRQVVKVFVSRKVPESELRQEEIVPKQVEEFGTDVEEMGIATAQQTE